jgi:hypothetical protein
MVDQVIAKIIKQQRPYYFLQGNTIKGIDTQYWLIFKHRDADNFLNNIVSFLGLVGNHHNYKLIRIDLNTAHLFYYAPKNEKNLPNNTLLRTSKVEVIEKFLEIETVEREDSLLAGSFRELETKIERKRKFNLPEDKDKYHKKKFNELETDDKAKIRNYNFIFNKLDSSYRKDLNKLKDMYEILNRSSRTLNDYEFNKVTLNPFYDIISKYKPLFKTFFRN